MAELVLKHLTDNVLPKCCSKLFEVFPIFKQAKPRSPGPDAAMVHVLVRSVHGELVKEVSEETSLTVAGCQLQSLKTKISKWLAPENIVKKENPRQISFCKVSIFGF